MFSSEAGVLVRFERLVGSGGQKGSCWAEGLQGGRLSGKTHDDQFSCGEWSICKAMPTFKGRSIAFLTLELLSGSWVFIRVVRTGNVLPSQHLDHDSCAVSV
uniref:Uncharacterized protein n=1 Tax=Oxyrrhis marina TaxID=2969 RepID=A0A7S3XIU1_OXYMA